MRLLFKQRVFSWFDSYDIYDEEGNTVFVVKGQFSWGHCLHILDAGGNHVGTVKERVISFLPKFEMYLGDEYMGCIRKEFTLFKPVFTLECNDWSVEGDWIEWDYRIRDGRGAEISSVSKELWHWSDTYTIDIADPENALCVLMIVLAIDAEKCSRR